MKLLNLLSFNPIVTFFASSENIYSFVIRYFIFSRLRNLNKNYYEFKNYTYYNNIYAILFNTQLRVYVGFPTRFNAFN